ncbi:SbtR family transcriptional regulator [Streptomyces fagopyri]|uniref:SbtR family transcriptional regulator n=1 Tax=Streptomyces fagopyri TaxID=2662397 RepID=UPI003899FDD3
MLDDPDPFRRFLRRLRLHRVSGPTGRGPAAGVMSAKPQDGTAVNTRCNVMKAAGAQLLVKAQSADGARDSIDVGDPLLVVHGSVVINGHLPTSPDRPERMLDVTVDALRRVPWPRAHAGVLRRSQTSGRAMRLQLPNPPVLLCAPEIGERGPADLSGQRRRRTSRRGPARAERRHGRPSAPSRSGSLRRRR